MKRTLIYYLVFLIAGILTFYCFPKDYTAVSVVLVLSFAVSSFFYYRYRLRRIFLFPIFTIIGMFSVMLAFTQPFYIQNDYESFTVYGEVIAASHYNSSSFTCIIKTEKLLYNNSEINQHLKIFTYNNTETQINTGDIIKAQCSLRNLRKDKNSEFNLYRSQNITLIGTTDDLLKIGEVHSPYYYRDLLKNGVFRILDKSMPETESSVFKAFLTGDSEFLSTETKETFRKAGIYHILAISGLHMGILSSILFFVFRLKSKHINAALTVFILVLYCLFTGGSTSAVRSVIMLSTFIAAPLFKRSADFITSACTACILILIFSPLLLFNVGFLYSFGIIFSIGFIIIPICGNIHKRKISKFLISCVIIQCISKFISAYFFYYISIYDILTNIAVLFFADIAFILGILTVSAGFVVPFLSPVIGTLAAAALTVIEAAADFFAGLPYSYINTGKPSIFFCITFLTAMFFIIYLLYNKRKISAYKRYAQFAVIIFIIINIIPTLFVDNHLKIDMLYVKEGDCISCTFNNIHFAIDGGNNTYLYNNGTIQTIENRTLLNFYEKQGITALDYVFVTHTDSDHIDGIINLIGRRKINKAVLSATTHDSENYRRFKEKCQQNNIEIIYMKKGDSIDFGSNLSVECLYPEEDTGSDGNSSSLVLMLKYDKTKILFTGDIDKTIEERLLNEDIKADILKVAHHGSKTASSEEFINAVNPSFAVVSAGINNKYNFPAEETVSRFNNSGIPLYCTADNGNIHITSDGKTITVSCNSS